MALTTKFNDTKYEKQSVKCVRFFILKGCEWGGWVEGSCEKTSCDEDEGNQKRSRQKFKDCKGGLRPEEITDPNADCTECNISEEECVYNATCVTGE